MTTELREAIDRSISHNEIVHLDWDGGDELNLVAALAPYHDGEIESVLIDGRVDVWGFQDGPDGQMDWRLSVCLT